jgi:hypothetical protein
VILKSSEKDKPPAPRVEKFPALKADEVCAIIKQCGHSGVRELTFYGLSLSFGNLANVQAMEPVFVPHDIQEKSDSQAREAIARREQEIKDDLIQDLLVNDPEGYEDLLKQEELVDDGQEDTEEN